jgi:hypothetical protein
MFGLTWFRSGGDAGVVGEVVDGGLVGDGWWYVAGWGWGPS